MRRFAGNLVAAPRCEYGNAEELLLEESKGDSIAVWARSTGAK